GPSKRSRKDPEYSRIATRLAGGPRSVFCWNKADWEALGGTNKKTIKLGYVEFRSPRQVNLSPLVCSRLDLLRYKHRRPPPALSVALGVLTYTHELEHTVGNSDEAVAQCLALQQMAIVSRALGTSLAYGRALTAKAWRDYAAGHYPGEYYSSECHDGGRLDLDPEGTHWP